MTILVVHSLTYCEYENVFTVLRVFDMRLKPHCMVSKWEIFIVYSALFTDR